jgi:hypothetical protein
MSSVTRRGRIISAIEELIRVSRILGWWDRMDSHYSKDEPLDEEYQTECEQSMEEAKQRLIDAIDDALSEEVA